MTQDREAIISRKETGGAQLPHEEVIETLRDLRNTVRLLPAEQSAILIAIDAIRALPPRAIEPDWRGRR